MLAEPLAITAVGMATSLGTARTACAAARAGVSRVGPLGLSVEDAASRQMAPVFGHVVGELTAGFGEVGLMVRLAGLALADLFESCTLTPAELQSLAVAVNLPSAFYFQQVDELRARLCAEHGHQPSVPEVDEPGSLAEGFDVTRPLYQDALVEKLFRAARSAPPPRERRAVFFGDQPGVGQAVLAAHRWLESGEAKACIVLGVDSLVEPRWLRATNELGILHTPLHPVGLVPGEAAACLVLQRRSSVRERRALGLISGCRLDGEQGHRFSDTPAVGRALGRAVRGCLEEASRVDPALSAGRRRSVSVISDLNGDPARATDFGSALVGLSRDVDAPVTLFPATQFGDTRAASGFLGVCMALAAFERGYARSSSYLLCASGDDGARAAVAVTTPAMGRG